MPTQSRTGHSVRARNMFKHNDTVVDPVMQFKTTDIKLADQYEQQTNEFKEKLKKMQQAKEMGFRFAKLF